MSVSIRLQRKGSTHKPFYQVVAADSRAARDGKFIERLGYYDPNVKPSIVELNADRLQYWFGTGATISDQVNKLAKIKQIPLERKKTHSRPQGSEG